MKKITIKNIKNKINFKLKKTYENDKISLSDKEFEWKYPDGCRQITEEMIKDYLKDDAYIHMKNKNDLIDEIFKLANNTPAEIGSVEQKHISNEYVYIAINNGQVSAYKNFASLSMVKTAADIPCGLYFTPDNTILPTKIKNINSKIKHIRKYLCLTKGFKKNVGAILQFWIDNDGIDVEVSKIGGQFDFVDKKYYKASKIIQYYIFDNIEKNKEHMLFSNIFYIEYK